jgi:hypothetical protein
MQRGPKTWVMYGTVLKLKLGLILPPFSRRKAYTNQAFLSSFRPLTISPPKLFYLPSRDELRSAKMLIHYRWQTDVRKW